MYEGLMVSVSGVRGRVGEALTPEVVARFAAGVRRVGHRAADGRVRGASRRGAGQPRCRARCSIASSLAALQSVGCDVIDIGLTTTPPASSRSSTTTPRAA